MPICAAQLALVKSLSVEPFMKGSAMVENAVQNDAHPSCVRLLYQLCEKCIRGGKVFVRCCARDIKRCGFIRFGIRRQNRTAFSDDFPEMGVDMPIILRIVFMIAWRNKKRIEIKHLYAQLRQIVQLIEHALQIAAVKTVNIACGRQAVPIRDLLGFLLQINIFIRFHIIGDIPIGKAIGVNLIHHRALRPIGGSVITENPKFPFVLIFRKKAVFCIIAYCFAALQAEIIGHFLRSRGQGCLKIRKSPLRFRLLHEIFPFIRAEENSRNRSSPDTKPHIDPIRRGRLRRRAELPCFIAIDCLYAKFLRRQTEIIIHRLSPPSFAHHRFLL